MRPIIEVRGISKQYQIGTRRARYGSLRESLTGWARAPFSRMRTSERSRNPTIWALKDVSFDVMPGEVIGIIGRNGAGKSTLLKVLTRITEPTKGTASLYGRVASLLEVGTGFHPELTGRENVYLNGAILGMRKAEIDRRFHEIVSFAEVERFIDTPVKHFSSGMYTRLAFAVAVHLEPEILLVDEVLAVGDAEFQKKCFRKMTEVARGGRTILFVSHNMSAVRTLCRRGLILRAGEMADIGEIDVVVDSYLGQEREGRVNGVAVETDHFVVEQVQVQGVDAPILKTFSPVRITATFYPRHDVAELNVYFGFLTSDYNRIAGLDLKDFVTVPPLRSRQRVTVGFIVESWPFLRGTYLLELHIKDMSAGIVDVVPDSYEFEVAETAVYGGRRLDNWFGSIGLKVKPVVEM